jgi:primosomal protein N' (replication factor Y) (superfamily II helicase)
MTVLRLAIPSPLRTLFDYLPPEELSAEALAGLRPGQRLRVPFGHRELTAYLVKTTGDSDQKRETLKTAVALLDSESLLPESLAQLCQWAADYYQHPAGEVLSAAFPKALREGKPHRILAEPGWQLTTRGKGLPHGALARSPKQSRALELLQGSSALGREAMKDEGVSTAVLRALEQKGLAQRCEIAAKVGAASSGPGLTLNDEQSATMASLRESSEGFSCHLLEGVTGSGKTEVYLQLIADCLARTEQALVLIPEIGLTPQTLARFSERFDANIAVLHSGLTDAQRYRAWEAARDGSAHIVIGTRSAIFTPLARPGLIVVDEEHDGSFKQQDGFRYSARDVAVKRGQLESCTVLLGSATPSLESLSNALQGRYVHHRLTKRAGNSQLPEIKCLDVRRLPLQAGISEPLMEALRTTLDAGQQALLFLNRRGYAPTLQCHDCGWIAQCRHCDARLTLHRRRRQLRCHHCSAIQPLSRNCPECRSEQLLSLGLGTEQSEHYLEQQFPDFPIYRVDSDTMVGRDAMQSLVTRINQGEPCILLGTQMLTKGHHFPGVSLVAVIDMDAMLFSTDFRGEERSAQLLTQVAGRAGREGTAGRVILQSHHPDHPSLQAMLQANYHQQAMAMLADRRQRGLPPSGYLLMIRSDCKDGEYGEQFLRELRSASESAMPAGVTLIGPLPAPMQRRAGLFRSQLLIQASSRTVAQQAARVLVHGAGQARPRQGLNWSIDVDPQDLF